MRHNCTEYKLSALQVTLSEEINSTLRHSSSGLRKYQAAR